MKNLYKILIINLLYISTFAQQATDLDPKFLKLPRYANLTAITTAIPSPTQGMMVYNIATSSNWYYDGSNWVNTLGAGAAPLNLSRTTAGVVGDCTICGERYTNGDPLNPTVDGGYGVYGRASGSQVPVGVHGAGVKGIGVGYNYGVEGYSDFVGVKGTSDNGIAGQFSNSSNSNANAVLQVTNQAMGKGAEFININNTNTEPAIYADNVGNGVAGQFVVSNTSSANVAVYSRMDGLGQSARFQIFNLANSMPSIMSETNGTGEAFKGTNNSASNATAKLTNNHAAGFALETSGGLKFGGTNVGTPAMGKVLTALDAVGNATWQNVLPLTTVSNSPSNLLDITNTGIGHVARFISTNSSLTNSALFASTNSNLGQAAKFETVNSSNNAPTLWVQSNGMGTTLTANMLGSGSAASFQTAITGTHQPTIQAQTSGTGVVGDLRITNASSANTVLFLSHSGTGKALRATNGSSTDATISVANNTNLGTALDITGGIKVSGTNKAAFKIVSEGGVGTNIYINQLIIPNTSLANNINDILIITHNYGAGATNNFTKPCGVFWEAGTSTWRIYVEDGSAMPVGITFNVLVIKQ